MSLAWLKVDAVMGLVGKLAAGSLLVATLGITGCGDDPVKSTDVAKPCTLNSECEGDLVCSSGLCHQECTESDDCPGDQRCVQTETSNVCQLQTEVECRLTSDCGEPLVCAIDFQCRNQCNTEVDCLKGQTCANHVCAEPSEVNDDGDLTVPDGVGGAPNGGGGGAGGQGGGGGTTLCTPGDECVPDDQPCAVGVVSCDGDEATCEVAADAEDGTECGTDEVCSSGDCVACATGSECQPDANDVCVAGVLSCALGPVCEPDGGVANGTSCGTDKVCSNASCVSCVAGAACTPTNACKNGALSCTNGPACVATTSKAAGEACGADKVCNSGGSCVSCVQDGPCEPAGYECHQGQLDCSTGPNCVDSQLPVTDGVSCDGSAPYNFCTAGECLACQNGTSCIPSTNVCKKGLRNCQTEPPSCTEQQANADDGLACGDNKSCISGGCVDNDRVLSIVGATPPAVAIDGVFAAVTVKLLDKNGVAVQGAAVTVTATAGAFALSSSTGSNGNASITGRVGRAVGSYTYTVAAPGASSVQFSVDAIAATAGNVFTVVNINHLSGVATPGAGTISKLYGEARAVTSAKDGTLYLASQCMVFKLTPSGVLSRVAGKDNGSYELCDFTGDSGPGTDATLYYVADLALDETNNFLYIADYSNHRVRQVDLSSGTIFTFAGGASTNVQPWGDDGPADQAYLTPSGVSVAPNGDVYISDANSGHLRKVDVLTNVISSYLSRVTCNSNNALSFYGCNGYGDSCDVAWDKDGKVFISAQMCGEGQSYFYGVARVDVAGQTKTLVQIAGTSGTANVAEGGVATSATYAYTPSIAFDKAGNLYTVGRGDHRIRRIDAATKHITTLAGTGTAGNATDHVAGSGNPLSSPTSLAVDDQGNLHFADSGNDAIRTLAGVGKTVASTATLATSTGTGQSVKIDAPFGALVVKLTDSGSANIQGVGVAWRRLQTGSGLTAVGLAATSTNTSSGGTATMTGRVGLLAGDYTFEASYTDIHGTPVSGSPQTFSVAATNPDAGIIFAIANYNHLSNGTLPSTTGPAVFSKLQYYVQGVTATSDGTIFVADYCAVYKITNRGEISVFAGTPGSCEFAGDSGPAVGAKLYFPRGLAVDEVAGVLYIADYQNHRIRVVDLSTGVINTFAGGGAVNAEPWGIPGTATDANIGNPNAVSVDADGVVYIPDAQHYAILAVDPDTNVISTWLDHLYPTGCAANVPALHYATDGSVVRFNAAGDAFVSGQICPGTATAFTNASPGIIKIPAGGGAATRIVGLYSGTTTEDADAINTNLPDLSDFVIDSSGNLVLAMQSQHRLRKISGGKINTIAGDGTAGYVGDYEAASGARFYNPYKLAFTPGGHLLISDYNNATLRMIW